MSAITRTGTTNRGGSHEFKRIGEIQLRSNGWRWFGLWACEDPGCEGKLYRCWRNGGAYKFACIHEHERGEIRLEA